MTKVLLTGGCGFVGHHFVDHFLFNTDWEIIVLDRLNYSGRLDRLRDIGRFDDKRVLVLTADFSLPISEGIKAELQDVNYILHLGAETHVDRSIVDPVPFVTANVMGTVNLLNLARELPSLECFYYFSTDEVFGPAPEGVEYSEDDSHNPTNGYSASKSSGEMFVKAYRNTYGLPCVITRSMNIFGERQNAEKFIPLVMNSVLRNDFIAVHADPKTKAPGTRFYIHARNVADGYLFLINEGLRGDWHITGSAEIDNLSLALFIANTIGKDLRYDLVDFAESRPGHDLRYSLSGEKLKQAGWTPPVDVWDSLRKTIEWTLENERWLVV